MHSNNDQNRVLLNPKQSASFMMQFIAFYKGYTEDDMANYSLPISMLHVHDAATSEISFNNAQSVRKHNEFFNDNLPVPLVATEGYNRHYHTGEMDGGYIAGRGMHDHRDNFNGGFAFAIFSPGTALPQRPWAI